jgi:hypothetical protein
MVRKALDNYKKEMDMIANLVREKKVTTKEDLLLLLGCSWTHLYGLLRLMKKMPEYKDIEIMHGGIIRLKK